MGKSVSRVGGKAQLPAYRFITGNLKLDYSQFEELENYARFGTRLDEHTQTVIEHGKRIRNWLKQQELHPMSVPEQLVVLLALTNGLFDTVPVDEMSEAQTMLADSSLKLTAKVLKQLVSDADLSLADRDSILANAGTLLAPFQAQPDSQTT